MSLMDSGKWQPLETDNSTIYRCMSSDKKTPTENVQKKQQLIDNLSLIRDEIKILGYRNFGVAEEVMKVSSCVKCPVVYIADLRKANGLCVKCRIRGSFSDG